MAGNIHARITLITAALLTSTLGLAAEAPLENWVQSQTDRALDYVYASISPKDGALGAVMASPSRHNPDYYAHWVRDAAVTMREVWAFRRLEPQGALSAMKDYAVFSLKNQTTRNWSSDASNRNAYPKGGVSDTGDLGIGEPKFYIDGSPYDREWGRPQNDGPALRVLALLGLADELMLTNQQDFVNKYLYRLELPARTVIKADLEFVSHHWRDTSVDLWEENRGDHFYTRMVQWRALHEGAIFAKRMGDTDAAAFYRSEAGRVLDSLNDFWSNEHGYLVVTRNYQRLQSIVRAAKDTDLDIAVVLAALHAGKEGFPFNVDDDRMIATAHALELAFDAEYSINRVRRNRDGLFMAPALGRYPRDRYNGHDAREGEETWGNPWFVATHAMAEFLLRLRGELKAQGQVEITPISRPFFQDLVKTDFSGKRKLREGDPSYEAVLKALQERSDAYLRRSQYHTGDHGHQSEQINRDHGYMQGAYDLTWSYASFLSLRRIRERTYE
jgi:glucoamylase